MREVQHVELEWYRCSCGFIAVGEVAIRRHIRYAMKAQEGRMTRSKTRVIPPDGWLECVVCAAVGPPTSPPCEHYDPLDFDGTGDGD